MEKYDVISVVGEGSYGVVMKCKHRETGQFVAIKKFLETEDDPTVRKMAIREIRMLKKLRHENLVNMIEVFRRKKRFFLVFEYLEHTILEELEARSGGLGFTISRKYVYQILRALDFIHSHNVIHRDIKPENVLVSRLGVIKLCDFGFARLYAENETFTDYVATRWYRSPELLVGDPRYGKEVDIWAVGCLYAEMMTGEPLFPGESDIDQLFQIIRVLGKLNTKHEILITQNSMFKGMKQEQNTNLFELFPDWDANSLDFLQQCLKMDSVERPNTETLLKHNLFTKDNFINSFLTELQTKVNQETQSNPLLKRLNFQYDLSNKNSEERFKGNGGVATSETKTTNGTLTTTTTTAVASVPTNATTKLLERPPTKTGTNSKERTSQISLLSLNAHRPSYGTEEQLAPIRHYLTNAATLAAQSKQQQQIKQISINNLVFQDNSIPSITNNNRLSRILSAKLQKLNQLDKLHNFPLPDQQNDAPLSPTPFQSLQPDINYHHTSSLLNHHELTMQGKRLSPVNSTLSSVTGHYFNQRRNSNTLNNYQVIGNNQKGQKNYLQNSQNSLKSNIPKPSRASNLIDNIFPISTNATANNAINSSIVADNSTIKDISPRILPNPSWLTSTNDLKVHISPSTSTLNNNHKSSILNNKKNLTDWKNVTRDPNDFLSLNCPGTLVTSTSMTSPYKGNKKKLSPMLAAIAPPTSLFQEKVLEATPGTPGTTATNQIAQNCSIPSDQETKNKEN